MDKWRSRYAEFGALFSDAIVGFDGAAEEHRRAAGRMPLAKFRQDYFGHSTPKYMAQVLGKLQHAEAGSFTMILMPPRHGKTTLIEQWVAWNLAYDRHWRVLFATSDEKKSAKRVQNIQSMLSIDGSSPRFAEEFGPFKPEGGTDQGYQPWTKQFFNIRGKNTSSERDYNVEAVGIQYAISGSRCDWLVFDDIQDTTTLSQSSKMLDRICQDWLSRPGSKGRTVMIGTRVGPNDIYDAILAEGLVTDLVQFPAVLEGHELWPKPLDKTEASLPPPGVKFLWPEEYTRKDYLIMRKNAKEVGWERNYMQIGADSASAPFSDDMILTHSDKLRSVNTRVEDLRRQQPDMQHLVVTLDPGFGVNACMIMAMFPWGMAVLDGRLDKGLQTNAQIAAVCGELMAKWALEGLQVTHLVIEDKAFQKGLMKDEAFRELQVKYGFTLTSHNTGGEKNDPDIGVPSLAGGFHQQRIIFPGADDQATQEFMRHIRSQFVKWRPGKRGGVLTQDYVITTWFGWLRWRKLRNVLDQLGPNPDRQVHDGGFNTGGLPYEQGKVLLLTGGGVR